MLFNLRTCIFLKYVAYDSFLPFGRTTVDSNVEERSKLEVSFGAWSFRPDICGRSLNSFLTMGGAEGSSSVPW